jgi:3D (Asp-Asp-Asp) domain-containing protein
VTALAAAALWTVTAYGLGCDAPGPRTKAGTLPVPGFTIAADPRVLPLGSIVLIEGLGERQVHDVGSGVVGRHVDVYVGDCGSARRWGRRLRRVTMLHRGGSR